MSAAGDSAADAALAAGSPERFGYAWERYDRVLPEHEEQFLRWTGLDRSFWAGARFLDGGCGIGRNAYWPMTYGARGGLAIDVDARTLAAARRNLADFPAVEIRRQSLYDLTETAAFDIAFSIGVVHHLADPDAAVARLVAAVRPGGEVLLWLYGREGNGWIVHLFDPLRRTLFSRLPLRLIHALSWPLTAVLWGVLRCGVPRGPYYRLLRGFTFAHLRAIVFDHMIPRIARYYTRAAAEDLLTRAGLIDIRTVWVNRMSWSVRGRRPD
jgi:SAM-dependent methyltransferase